MRDECVSKTGDLTIGYLTMVRQYGTDEQNRCTDQLAYPFSLQFVETFAYAISNVNEQSGILDNITLGYVILDTCNNPLSALWASQHFTGQDTDTTDGYCEEGVASYKVSAVVGPHTSAQAELAASLLGFYQIPTVSTLATSNELTEDVRFKYFLRVVPPDHQQAMAILDFVYHLNWTYVSLVFSRDSYGENGARFIENGVKQRHMCFAVIKAIALDAPDADFVEVIGQLVQYRNARAIILFITPIIADHFFRILQTMDLVTDKEFIFIGSDGIWFIDPTIVPAGTFGVQFRDSQFDSFDKYYRSLVPANSTSELWMKLEWERLHACSWDNSSTHGSCYQYEHIPDSEASISSFVYKIVDAVWTLAYAMDRLIKENCPSAMDNKSILMTCMNGPRLLQYALNTSFDGITGKVQFDSHGDIVGQYNLKQMRSNNWETIVTWIEGTELIWERDIATVYGDHGGIPQSVCSKPCLDNEYQVPTDIQCCWQCKPCKINEVPGTNGSECHQCPDNYWPDDAGLNCILIQPTYMLWTDSMAIGLTCLSGLGILTCLIIGSLWIVNRDRKLIKASSREVSFIVLLGVLIALVDSLVFILQPTSVSCMLRMIGFHLSVTLIYAVLLVKTNRVYRIFSASRKGIKNPKLVSTGIQLVFILVLIFTQVSGTYIHHVHVQRNNHTV